MLSFLILVLLVLVVAGVVVWGVGELPLDPVFKNVARAIVIVVIVIWIAFELYRRFA